MEKGKELILINKLIVAKESGQKDLNPLVQDAYKQVMQNPKSKYNVQLAELCSELGFQEYANDLLGKDKNRQE